MFEKKNNRDTIHFNGEYCNIDLPYRTVHSANQPCINGAVTKCVEQFWRSKSKQTRKYSQDISRNASKAGGSQVIGWYSKTTACFGKPNAPEFERFQFDAICEQNGISPNNGEILPSDRVRKSLCHNYSWRWWMGKTHINVQRIFSAQKSGGVKAMRINWCRTGNWSGLIYWDCYSYWWSWHWSTSTITEFPRILRMDFDKSWSRKICDWNSSSQLWHCELQFLVAHEGRKPQECVFRIFQTCRGKSRARLTRFEQCQNEGWTFKRASGNRCLHDPDCPGLLEMQYRRQRRQQRSHVNTS